MLEDFLQIEQPYTSDQKDQLDFESFDYCEYDLEEKEYRRDKIPKKQQVLEERIVFFHLSYNVASFHNRKQGTNPVYKDDEDEDTRHCEMNKYPIYEEQELQLPSHYEDS